MYTTSDLQSSLTFMLCSLYPVYLRWITKIMEYFTLWSYSNTKIKQFKNEYCAHLLDAYKIKFYNYPKLVFWRILTNPSYKLCFYHYQKLQHRTPFTTALGDVKKSLQGSGVNWLSSVRSRLPLVTQCRLDTKHNKASLSFRCNLATEQKWQPPCGEAAWEQFGLYDGLVSILQNTNFG